MFKKFADMETSFTFDDVLIKPAYSDILPSDVCTAIRLNDKIELGIPVMSAAMDTVTEYDMAKKMIELGGIGVLHKNMSLDLIIKSIEKLHKEFGDSKPIATSVGVGSTDEHIKRVVEAGANVLIVDSAHGHSKGVGDVVEKIKIRYPEVFLIAGNIVTKEAAAFLIDKGADAVKVGVGPGAICTTRVVTGVGAGQISSLKNVSSVAKLKGALVIADGGMKQTGDITKAIVAGADMVMLGSMLAGTKETPGKIIEHDGEKYKSYRGMGSLKAMKKGSKDRYNQSSVADIKLVPEGIEGFIKYKGLTEDVIQQIVGGLRNGMGYIGASTIQQAHENGQFVRITQAGFKTSNPHTLDKILPTTNFKGTK
ncbi:IMP dehydrogenase [Mycoplasma marinum]|uniref:Guanosine monophosphate reductase n=1 Tax=Mycoplasma marinum TaxID=1937190 RepID=A0A4V2NIA0_9MOLU|nr:IMP dehydrogenase [Mycoplasma marinum]TCG11528.1 guanosine monophosphate reductase [Mycoplasma marinum]